MITTKTRIKRDSIEMIELALLKFTYNNGKLFRGEKRSGCIKRDGYRGVNFMGFGFYEHRLIFAMHHKMWPKSCIDHIDGDPLNNKIENLREATRSQNQRAHRRVCRNSSSKYRGVSWSEPNKKWRVQIKINKKCIHVGYFESEIKAALAYNEAAKANGFLEESLNSSLVTIETSPPPPPTKTDDN